MAYTTNQLISGAYYAAGVVSREFETVNGSQITDGLQWLNDVLSDKDVEQSMVPYESTYSLTFVPGQEAYFIEDLIQIDTVTFYLNEVRFSMQYTKRNQYFGSSRVENIQSLPNQWYWERGFGGGTLYVYFKPNQAYPVDIHGVFRLASVALGQDLSLTLDQFYISYLRYALADRICAEYNYQVPEGVAKYLAKYQSWIDKKSRIIDLRMQKSSTLQKRGHLGYGYINLGRGWMASS